MNLQKYFEPFRAKIAGINANISTPYHDAIRIVYADWTASGRAFLPIEERFAHDILPLVANTHTDTTTTGMAMTYAYHRAQQLIKKHVGAGSDDVLITSGTGMTGAVNKFQRILGLRLHEKFRKLYLPEPNDRPVVFITHMEHHSNQTSWLETIAEVVIIPPGNDGRVSPDNFRKLLNLYTDRKLKIAAVTGCSNVTGLSTPYFEIAEIIHAAGGLCFVDFACSAPYVDIHMHENDANGRYLDAIYFSPHKFLGGPGSCGVLIFNKSLYHNSIPDAPGGGTVDWTNPWGQHKYVDDIEAREDGGTPGFLQTMRVALAMQLKNRMGVQNMLKREEEILNRVWNALKEVPGLHVLADEHKHRLAVVSFYIDGLHYALGVKMLNDRFGIQTRGGCSCAGTYGHYLLNVTPETSESITSQINSGDCSTKPGWIRMSFHPTHTDEEVDYITDAIQSLAVEFREWSKDYNTDFAHGIISNKNTGSTMVMEEMIDGWFNQI